MKHVVTVGSLVLALAAGSAFAADQAPPATGPVTGAKAPVEFSSLDANKDGKVTMAEVQSNDEIRGEFSKLDTNHDDSLSASEFAQFKGKGSASGSAGSKTYSAPSESADSPSSSQAPGAADPTKRESL